MPMNRIVAPQVRPFGGLHMPPEEVETLDNGMRLHLVSGGNQPVSRISVLFGGGVCELENNYTGKLTTRAVFDGADGYTPDAISDFIDFNGLRVGAVGHLHNTSAGISVLNHRVKDVMPVLGRCIQSPTFPAERFMAALTRARAEIRTSRQEVSLTAAEAFSGLMCGESHPLAHKSSEADLDGFGPEKVADLYARFLCPEKMHVFLGGMLDEGIVDAVRNTFGAIQGRSAGIERRVVPYAPVASPVHLRVRHDHTFQSAVVAGMPAIPRSHPDYIPLRLTVMALGGYFGSRLVKNIREEKGLTYGITATLNGAPEGSYVEISAMCDRKYASKVLEETGVELRMMATNPPQGDELDRLKLSATTTLAETLDTPFSRMNYYQTKVLVGTSDDYFNEQFRQIQALTPETIAHMAAKYLDPQNMSTVTAGLIDE